MNEWLAQLYEAMSDLNFVTAGGNTAGKITALVSLEETAAAWRAELEGEPQPDPEPEPTPTPGPGEMWLSVDEIMARPASGPAWNNVLDAAQANTGQPDISDQDDKTDVSVLAKALVYARTGITSYRHEVVESLMAAIGTEAGAGILAVCRALQAYVIAADLINLSNNRAEDGIFRNWLDGLRHVVFSGAGPSLSIVSCHEVRPNNFGTHAGASRIAIALYLDDTDDLARAADVFHGWLGNYDLYHDFDYGDLAWQADQGRPVGINPAGATKEGHNVDGVLPDDQRRSGGFKWPPPKENYVFEALQGAVVQAQLLHRAGYPAWEWQERALLRAMTWLNDEADYPAEGDDRNTPWLVNLAYGSDFPAETPTTAGKGMGWMDWTHGP